MSLLPLLAAGPTATPHLTTWALTGLDLGRGEPRAGAWLRGQAPVFRNTDAGTGDRCPNYALGLREDDVGLLRRVTRFSVKGDRLALSEGKGRLLFRAQGSRR